ncbi:leucyl/phenylalanyl-tRNA--protein transferase [Nocardioides baekrokdamisoli]|uniref:Leucyl/phenylalanyl-tRNA--protein transferase n=1 Tax=Nocardioides baekrokdamisoli TaxID=1804624 RepID=A0A3G9IY44_9ACTN|nr:leucyl/phenylalanyl-tRNA--protein transferase [Nocardioides baekrokdamisoli]BBH17333.1 leucyl/phenylalanyl-tRNA--protein transferase [Nocardioides baekrokdamisoli]
MPIEPEPSPWIFPDARSPEFDDDLVAVGADLAPGTLLAAYRSGLFPMPGPQGEIWWYSPVHRGILPLDGLRVTRSLTKSLKRFEIRVDTAFVEVVRACADPSRDGAWIDEEIISAYAQLHELGWAHSVEAWQDGVLVGGLYGLSIGGLFAGESMFHHVRDASKAALVGLVDLLGADGTSRLLDVQWQTDHLASLGVIEISRADYLTLLGVALDKPSPAWPSAPS